MARDMSFTVETRRARAGWARRLHRCVQLRGGSDIADAATQAPPLTAPGGGAAGPSSARRRPHRPAQRATLVKLSDIAVGAATSVRLASGANGIVSRTSDTTAVAFDAMHPRGLHGAAEGRHPPSRAGPSRRGRPVLRARRRPRWRGRRAVSGGVSSRRLLAPARRAAGCRPAPARPARLTAAGSRSVRASPVMRRNLRWPRLRSSTATSSWAAGIVRWSPPVAPVVPSAATATCSASRSGWCSTKERLHLRRQGLGLAAHDHELRLLDDRAVVGQAVELVALGGVADLGHAELDLVGLLLLGEDRAERLRVGVGERAGGDVAPVVGVAAQVGEPDAGDAQALELVVAPDGGEADAVVDLAHLVQRGAGVLGDEQDAVDVGRHDHAAAAGDALAGVLRAVAHDLLGRGVERHRHVGSSLAGGTSGGGRLSCRGGPPGRRGSRGPRRRARRRRRARCRRTWRGRRPGRCRG